MILDGDSRGTAGRVDVEVGVEDLAARRCSLWRVRLLCGWAFDGGLWDALFRFELAWLCAPKLVMKLVAKLIVGPVPSESWLGSSSSA